VAALFLFAGCVRTGDDIGSSPMSPDDADFCLESYLMETDGDIRRVIVMEAHLVDTSSADAAQECQYEYTDGSDSSAEENNDIAFASYIVHYIQPGDSLSSVVLYYFEGVENVITRDIMNSVLDANNMQRDGEHYVGQRIIIPLPEDEDIRRIVHTIASWGAPTVHVVQPDESLLMIAELHFPDVDVYEAVQHIMATNRMIEANFLHSHRVLYIVPMTYDIGSDAIFLPPRHQLPVTHLVQAGESLNMIARMHFPNIGVDEAVQHIMEANGFLWDANHLWVGMRLVIPDIPQRYELPVAPISPHVPELPLYHIVQAGEYLRMIAQMYFPDVDADKALQHIMSNNNTIVPGASHTQVGMRLLIEPLPIELPTTHIIQAGDNLTMIARRYLPDAYSGVSLIIEANDLPLDRSLYVGMVLVIPAPPSEYPNYTAD